MALILCLETASTVCSVALMKDGERWAVREVHEGFRHAEKLPDFIRELVNETGITLQDLDAVAVSGGPGSYTGLRIGVSMAKGICWSLEKPLIAIPTLAAMASGAKHMTADFSASGTVLYCPLLDARRMEVYTAYYDASGNEQQGVRAEVITSDSFADIMHHDRIYFFGDGLEKAKPYLTKRSNAIGLDDFVSSAIHLGVPAEAAFLAKRFESTAGYEPFYFKEFVPGRGSVLPG